MPLYEIKRAQQLSRPAAIHMRRQIKSQKDIHHDLTAIHDLLASKQAQKAEAMEELRAARAEQAELQAEVEKIKANAKEFNLDMASSLTPQGYAENDVESEELEESEEDGG